MSTDANSPKRKRGRPPKPKPLPMAVRSVSVESNEELSKELQEQLPAFPADTITELVELANKCAPLQELRSSRSWKKPYVGNRRHFDTEQLIEGVANIVARKNGTTPYGELSPIAGSYDDWVKDGRRERCEADQAIRAILKSLGQPFNQSLRHQVKQVKERLS
jgi:hypothetical protein